MENETPCKQLGITTKVPRYDKKKNRERDSAKSQNSYHRTLPK